MTLSGSPVCGQLLPSLLHGSLSFDSLIRPRSLASAELLGGTESCLSPDLGGHRPSCLQTLFPPPFRPLLLLGFPSWTHRHARRCPAGPVGPVHFSVALFPFCSSDWLISMNLSSRPDASAHPNMRRSPPASSLLF